MGLVVQAPIDALLPVNDPAATAPGQTQGESGTSDVFAGLLASLSANLDAEPTGVSADSVEIPIGDLVPETDEKKQESNPFAALMAMTMPLAIATPTLLSAKTEETETVEAVAGAGTAVTSDGAELAIGDADALDELPATEATAPEAAAESTPMADVLPDVIATAAPSNAVPVEATAPGQTESPASDIEAIASVLAPPSKESSGLDEAPQVKTGEPPTEADGPQPEQTETTSVVRTVGNAEANNDTTDKGETHDGRGRVRSIERPQPRASAEGIAHAAAHSPVGELRQANDATPLDAPAPVDQPVETPDPQPVDQVANAVIERVEAGGGEARIHLHPVELGEVTIRVHTDGDNVRIAIHAERREAMNVLRDHTQDLSTLLGERGLNLSDVNVGFGRGNGSQTWGDDQRPQNRPVSGEFASVMGIDKDVPIERHQRLRAAYNPDGAHFFRV